MDGYQATAAIRAFEGESGRRRTPIVALTANAFQEDIARAAAAGVDGHLTKPMKKQALLAAIDAIARAVPADGAGPRRSEHVPVAAL